ncbi:hypothetical protein [Vampirovibrio sp.]|uniref:hypothetical protein n=1 Tax=Vampirovibrio sp. TaxID=2717857 RepID=UPI00359486A8
MASPISGSPNVYSLYNPAQSEGQAAQAKPYTNHDIGSQYFQPSKNQPGFTSNDLGSIMSAQTQQPQPLNDMTALARIQSVGAELDAQTTGEKDNKISIDDLRKAMEDTTEKYSKEDQEAIRYLLDNQNGLRGRLDQFDGKSDGLFTLETVNQVTANPNTQPKPKMSNTEAVITLKDHLRGQFKAGLKREDLFRLQNDEKAPEAVREAAKKLLENEALFKAADTGRDDDGNYDGHISVEDLSKLANRSDVDKIGGGSSSTTTGGLAGQSVVQNAYLPVSTGNPNADYYQNNVVNRALGPAIDAFRQANTPAA